MGLVVNATPRPLYARIWLRSYCMWNPGTVLTGAENLVLNRIRFPDRLARSKSLYWLSYRGQRPLQGSRGKPRRVSRVANTCPVRNWNRAATENEWLLQASCPVKELWWLRCDRSQESEDLRDHHSSPDILLVINKERWDGRGVWHEGGQMRWIMDFGGETLHFEDQG